jgi:hypothetical protein
LKTLFSARASCGNCGDGYADSIVDFKTFQREIKDIMSPEDCDCFAIYYKPSYDVLDALQQGRTFEGMVRDEIRNQGWNVIKSQTRIRGVSGVHQDVDVLCEKNGVTALVECKRIDSTKSITLGDVHDLFARMHDLEIKKGAIISTSGLVVKEAEAFAHYYGIVIVPVAQFLTKRLEELI